MSDQYNNSIDDERWSSNVDGRCTIVSTRATNLAALPKGLGMGFAWMHVDGMLVYKCYSTKVE